MSKDQADRGPDPRGERGGKGGFLSARAAAWRVLAELGEGRTTGRAAIDGLVEAGRLLMSE